MKKKLDKPKRFKLGDNKYARWTGHPDYVMFIEDKDGNPFYQFNRSENRNLYNGDKAIYED